MQIDEKISIIEAILFASGEPIEFDKLALGAGVELSDMHKLVSILNSQYYERSSALEVLKLENSYQLATKEQFAPYIRVALESRRTAMLSPAAMETLTIIAYNQPVTRSFVDDIRGVDSSGVVSNLLEKELIEDVLPLLESKIKPMGIVVCEHEAGLILPEAIGKLRQRKRYSYGKIIALTVYDCNNNDGED